MRRRLFVLAVVAVMAAMMALTLSTAFAYPKTLCVPDCLLKGTDNASGRVNTGLATGANASGDNSSDTVGGTNTNGVTNNPNYTPCSTNILVCT